MNAAQYFDHWNVVWRDLMRAVAVLRDEHLAFRPADKYGRTVGAILTHLLNLEEGWVDFVIRRRVPEWPAERSEMLGSVEKARAEMERVHHETMEYLKTVGEEDFERIVQVPGDGTPKLGWILWHVLEQEIHHRGELFLCLSLMGLDRPKVDRPE
jgi:uncharacterized damage-inducible protein DinB